MTQLVRFDTNTLNTLNRALIGFDDVFSNFERRFANQVTNNYPPYNLVKISDNLYQIDIAVTGFRKEEVAVTVEANELTIRGERNRDDDAAVEYLHLGLALRDFERSFTLAEHMKVRSASISNGILHIELEREIPEELKPRVIDVVEIK
jgi:molecular chaperone IbpA